MWLFLQSLESWSCRIFRRMKHFYDECPYNITLNCNSHKYHFIIIIPTSKFHTNTKIENSLLPSKFTNITYTPINYHIKSRGKFPNICLSMWFMTKRNERWNHFFYIKYHLSKLPWLSVIKSILLCCYWLYHGIYRLSYTGTNKKCCFLIHYCHFCDNRFCPCFHHILAIDSKKLSSTNC